MEAFGSISWDFLEIFFGQHGKLIAGIIGLLVALISFGAALLSHRRVVRLEDMLGSGHDKLQKQKDFYEKGIAALKLAEESIRKEKEAVAERERRLADVRSAFNGKEADLWRLHPPRKPDDYDRKILDQRRKPVVLVANLKGGVGKTTLTANLAAYFTRVGKRVLLIDADYQGSLSNMLLAADKVETVSGEINKLLLPGAGADTFMSARHVFTQELAGSALIASKYELAAVENRLMIEYLLNEDGQQDDGRYRLARLLLDPAVADTFDIAFIDAPPRLTAATINGFCASTHLLIPTVYDMLSAEAVGTFLNGVQTLKASLNPAIDLLGIVGMLTRTQNALSASEQNAKRQAMSDTARTWGANFHVFDRHIPRRSAIAQAAGDDIAYFCDTDVRAWFDQLGSDMSGRLWAAPAHAAPEPAPPGGVRKARQANGRLAPQEREAVGA